MILLLLRDDTMTYHSDARVKEKHTHCNCVK